MKKAVPVGLLAVGAVVGWLYWQQSRPVRLVVSGFIEADQVRVGSRVGGRVAEVLVEEGTRVQAGEPLFRIDPFDLRERAAEAEGELQASTAICERLESGYRAEEIAMARAERDRTAARLDKLLAGPRPREIEIARENLNRARADLGFAEAEHTRIGGLYRQGQAGQSEYDRAVQMRASATAAVAAAEQELALLEEGTRPEEVAEARASLAVAEQAQKLRESGFRKEEIAEARARRDASMARVAAIRAQLAELTVTAPCACVVEAIDLQPGDLVAPNAPAVSLLDLSNLWVRAYVPEARLGQVQLGQRAPIRVDSFPGRDFPARITFLAREAEFTPRNVQTPEERSKQVFRLKATLEEGMDALRVGMAADVLLDEEPGR